MKNFSRLDVIRLSAFGMLLILPAISGAEQLPPIAERMAKTYGLDSFEQVEAIRYTFDLDAPGLKFHRTWEWQPKTDTVSYEGKDKEGKPEKVTYQRSQLGSLSDAIQNQIDPGFFNDQFWLLLPLHVAWDGASVTDEGLQKLPSGNGSAERIVVKYAAEGYSPGDTWTLYVGPDKRVQENAFNRGGSKKPSVVITTWGGYKKAGPLLIATEHRGTADGKPLSLTFLDVSVKVKGSKNWINAQ
jgi:hypothetical protein